MGRSDISVTMNTYTHLGPEDAVDEMNRTQQLGSDNNFITNVLYRLGFKWPVVDDAYLEKVISAVESLDFFNKI